MKEGRKEEGGRKEQGGRKEGWMEGVVRIKPLYSFMYVLNWRESHNHSKKQP